MTAFDLSYLMSTSELTNRKARVRSMVAGNSFPYACLYGGQAIPCTSLKTKVISTLVFKRRTYLI